MSDRSLVRTGRLWTLITTLHTIPFALAAVFLAWAAPVTLPVGLILLAHAWLIPELYASRGANVVRPRGASVVRPRSADVVRPGPGGVLGPERVALGLLGDLIGHEARELHSRTGLVREPGALGVWLIGEAGALLVRPGGRRVHCYCVRATDPELPSADRTSHLLLALRADECGFATVANLSFSGACWRLRRRLRPEARPALAEARKAAACRPAARPRPVAA